MPLSSLRDYRQIDKREESFEVSLFAELFYEMVIESFISSKLIQHFIYSYIILFYKASTRFWVQNLLRNCTPNWFAEEL